MNRNGKKAGRRIARRQVSLNLVADLLARFVLGTGATVLFLIYFAGDFAVYGVTLREALLLGAAVGVLAALFGLREGPSLK